MHSIERLDKFLLETRSKRAREKSHDPTDQKSREIPSRSGTAQTSQLLASNEGASRRRAFPGTNNLAGTRVTHPNPGRARHMQRNSLARITRPADEERLPIRATCSMVCGCGSYRITSLTGCCDHFTTWARQCLPRSESEDTVSLATRHHPPPVRALKSHPLSSPSDPGWQR